MDWYLTVKVVHIISSTVLFGTGMGIAFFMFHSSFSDDLREKYYATSNTVMADYLFTLPAVIVQPLSGAWLVWTYVLYLLAGACWLPVVWIQHRLKTLATDALRHETVLPESYHRLFRYWMLLGWPAFASLILVFFLMVFKPS
jgi:uncharacterized membrane protein